MFYYIFISLQDTLDILDDVVKSLFVIILQSLIKMMSLVDLANFQAMLYKKKAGKPSIFYLESLTPNFFPL